MRSSVRRIANIPAAIEKTGIDMILGRIFTVKMSIRVALTALSIANIGVAHAEVVNAGNQPATMSTYAAPTPSGPATGIAATPTTPGSTDPSAQAAYSDIEATLGFVPGFFKAFPEAGVAGAWAEFKTVQLNPNTALSGKMKELIGLAVAAQIPCTYCVYFHTAAARANGASDEEVREAVAMAAISRHWSTVLNGMQVDLRTFKKETDTVLHSPAGKPAATATQ